MRGRLRRRAAVLKQKKAFTSQSREKADVANRGRQSWRRERQAAGGFWAKWLVEEGNGQMDVRKTEINSVKWDSSTGRRRPGVTLRSHLELCLSFCPSVSSLSCALSNTSSFHPTPPHPSIPPSLPPSTSPAAVLWRWADVEVSITERTQGKAQRGT